MKSKPANVQELETLQLQMNIYGHPNLSRTMKDLDSKGWKLFVVAQNRGRNYPHRKWITIPLWVLSQTSQNRYPGYWVWYVAHEFAHSYVEVRGNYHGPEFMEKLKEICPPEFVHYELTYKPKNATQAGISMKDAHKAVHVPLTKLEDLL